jgi:hypothetical protein
MESNPPRGKEESQSRFDTDNINSPLGKYHDERNQQAKEKQKASQEDACQVICRCTEEPAASGLFLWATG